MFVKLKNNQNGSFDPLLIPLVVAIVMLVFISGFAIYSYSNYLDASKVEEAEITAAVEEANAKLTEDLEVQFAEREKSPVRTYTSPGPTGSVKVTYPKTWSVYSEESESRGTVNSYFHPGFVRDTNSDTPVALRMEIKTSSYDNEVKRYDSKAERGEVTVSAIKRSGVTGVRVDGNIDKELEGSMVLFPLRDKTLIIWTENNGFIKDFNDIVLKNLKFSP